MTRHRLWLAAVLMSMMAFSVDAQLGSLGLANEWINSQPLNAADLRGKVVLVDFWTYTCINWRRTLPYLRAWADKYKDQNLVVIGVHTPEFSFEKDIDNIRRAAKEQKVGYPIAVDSEYAIWNAFDNRYWPAVYVLDARGRIRHHQFGEGDYEQLESVIRKLLAESGNRPLEAAPTAVEAQGVEVAADWKRLGSPETYVGYARAERLASRGRVFPDRARTYVTPALLNLNEWSLDGNWTIRREDALLNHANGKITYRFHARDVHLVMGPSASASPIRFRVLVDGQPPHDSHGVDVDEEGRGTIDQPRLYQLIRQPGGAGASIVDRQVEIEFLDAGVEVFVFTFG